MGSLLDLLLGEKNPVAQWAGSNSNLLTGLGTSLLSSGMNFAPAQQGAVLDQEASRQKDADAKLAASTNATKQWLAQKYPDLAQAVDAGLPVSEAWNEAFKRQNQKGTADPYQERFSAGQQYGLTGNDLNSFALTGALPGNKSGNITYGTTPIWGQDTATGQMGFGVNGSDGSFKMVDTGSFQPVDPASMAGTKAGATVDAKTAAGARAALPGAQIQRDTTLAAIDRITSDQKGLDEWFGQWGPRGMYVNPGSAMGNFNANFSQADGQSFLQARQFLKGQGAITEIESAKAEQAYSRMAAAKREGDQQNFLQAADDFKLAVEQGFAKLEATAAGGYAAGAPYSPSAINATPTAAPVPSAASPTPTAAVPAPTSSTTSAPSAIPTVSSKAGYDALPSGTTYIAPDGTTRTKP